MTASRGRSTERLRHGAVACALLATLACAGCGDTATSGGVTDPRALLLARPGNGFSLAAGTDQAMSVDVAARATVTPADDTRTQLGIDGYSGGWSRVWRGPGGSTVASLVFVFGGSGRPKDFAGYVRSYLDSLASTYTLDDAVIPGAFDYELNGSLQQGAGVFCQGVFYVLASTVSEVRTCAPVPAGLATAERLARAQFQQASSALGLPATTRSATPGTTR